MHRQLRILLPVCAFLAGSSASAVPALPTTWEVSYGIHETPSNPESRLTFIVTLSLERQASDGDFIGWHVHSVRIVQLDESEAVIGDWTHVDPTVQTTDGLWWTEHADPEAPQTAEFTIPPAMAGVGSAAAPNDIDLIYELEGAPYTPPGAPADPPYDVTAALSHVFRLVGETEPLSSAEEDPVESGPPLPD